MKTYLLTLFLSSALGAIYGFLFLYQKKALLTSEHKNTIFNSILFITARLLILIVVTFFLLRSSCINPILFLVTFFLFFWLTVIKYKVTL